MGKGGSQSKREGKKKKPSGHFRERSKVPIQVPVDFYPGSREVGPKRGGTKGAEGGGGASQLRGTVADVRYST